MGRLRVRQAPFGTTVSECASVEFSIPISPPTTPPYTLMVYPADRTVPITYPLTWTGQTALWTVDYPGPSVLTVFIVDSRGNSVGFPAQYTVQRTNGSGECLPKSRPTVQSPITAAIDLPTTDPFPQTCTPLLIHINGGQKPYNVTVIPVAIAPAFNITMGPNDDSLRWVNPFPPSTRFSVAVSDSQGASQRIQSYEVDDTTNSTTGGTDTNCPDSDTRSFNSNDPTGNSSHSSITASTTIDINHSTGQSENSSHNSITASTTFDSNRNIGQSQNSSNSNNQNHGVPTAAIAGGVVGAILLLALLFVLFRRRNRYGDGRRVDFLQEGQLLNPQTDYGPGPALSNYSGTGGSMHQIYNPPTFSVPPYYPGNPPSSSGPTSSVIISESMNTASHGASTVEKEKGGLESRPMNSEPQIFQHRDAGTAAELPPVYGGVPTH